MRVQQARTRSLSHEFLTMQLFHRWPFLPAHYRQHLPVLLRATQPQLVTPLHRLLSHLHVLKATRPLRSMAQQLHQVLPLAQLRSTSDQIPSPLLLPLKMEVQQRAIASKSQELVLPTQPCHHSHFLPGHFRRHFQVAPKATQFLLLTQLHRLRSHLLALKPMPPSQSMAQQLHQVLPLAQLRSTSDQIPSPLLLPLKMEAQQRLIR